MAIEMTSAVKTDTNEHPSNAESTNAPKAECLWLSPPAIAKRLGVNSEKVRAWIRAGELRASDFAEKLGGKPRYRVHVTDLVAFEKLRAVQPRTTTVRRRRKRPDDVIEFF